ncbi:caffeate O-methyltransferase 1, O-methyltransferase 1, O-methyltransferase 3 [Hibiscus trionum]|uniref:Caffeate O-methyltransferase 1, O-methyltransferase 1, O-methyltransferase 3 n=1 Tax=Hibiscus trionum TaxID=183268 RepID=A0A9W7I5B1_HIBTR|nr:caffeate O-methyltransferase 1, O-methyltransferase 1, O-methyltransferase 3 [Hibiscus trionum]
MGSNSDLQNISSKEHEEADILQAMHLASISSLPFALKVAVDLGLLEIISKADNSCGMLSATEIASQLPTNNPDAPSIVDRVLRLLATHSVLTCNNVADKDGHDQRSYGIASVGKYFLQNEDGISFAPLLNIYLEKYIIQCWKFMKDVTLEGGFSCVKAFGEHWFELLGKDDEMSKTFNRAMSIYTDLVMNQVLQTYKGFEGVSQVVDVGGGLGTNLKLIVSKYPHIKAVNFDLPQVIKHAPIVPGVEHVAGDMFTEIPKAEVIFMKLMLHDWGDDLCLKLLKSCYDSLPENGKIVLVESLIPEVPKTDIITKTILQRDLALFHILPGARERTKQEFEALAKQAGFSSLRIVCRAYNHWVMEINKVD